MNDETRPILEPVRDRLTWDAPIHSIADIEALPWPPKMVNIKPSRIGGLRELCETYDYCAERGIGAYGGGQWELGVGRGQIQDLASLFTPTRPTTPPRADTTKPSRRRACRPARCSRSWPRPASLGREEAGLRAAEPAVFASVRAKPTEKEPNVRDDLPRRPQRADRQRVRRLQQYIGAAVYYDGETLPRLAAFFYRQAIEERNHAMMMVQYLLDVDEEVRIPDIKAQQTSYADGAPR